MSGHLDHNQLDTACEACTTMMDPQQIRDALAVWDGQFASALSDSGKQEIIQAAAEYADLLDTSERVWWCGMFGVVNAKMDPDRVRAAAACRADPEDSPHREQYDCGWRLLTPTQGE